MQLDWWHDDKNKCTEMTRQQLLKADFLGGL